jgi:hypothetical protein
MARYGRDFNSGRYMSRDFGEGYDFDYNTPTGQTGWSSGRGHGWGTGTGRSTGLGGVNEGWMSGREQSGFGQDQNRNPQQWSRGDQFNEFGRGRDFGYGSRNYQGQDFGGTSYSDYANRNYGMRNFGNRNFEHRDFGGNEFGNREFGGRDFGGRGMYTDRMSGSGYDHDFGDRLRHGWNRFRNEARGWLGRGYDRGW